MVNLVLYRKYRPKTFAEIIDQEHVVQTLKNAISSGLVSHAYLFSGPRGTGKTTLARLLAKAVNCENLQGAEPCNKCSSCSDINRGRALDLIEIDAASHRGIDEIRELRNGIRFVPTKQKYKVFIIDESHQLTKEAANALLKTLEEPPSYAIFVLATTEIH
jgi:DNA polymerase-3 subunit gamma/tau